MITSETTQPTIDQRDIASLYTCIIFIGTGLGFFLPIIFMSNTLTLLISICAFTALVQLILLNKK